MNEILTKEEIKELFSEAVYQRGYTYYNQGRVRGLYFDPIKELWIANVRGTKTYHVSIQNGDFELEFHCDCPAFDQYWAPCKHIAAVLLKIFEQQSHREPILPSQVDKGRHGYVQHKAASKETTVDRVRKQQQLVTKQLIQSFIQLQQTETVLSFNKQKQYLSIEWTCKLLSPGYSNQPSYLGLQMKAGVKRLYIVRKITDFIEAIIDQSSYSFTNNFSFEPAEMDISNDDLEIIQILHDIIKNEQMYKDSYFGFSRGSTFADERHILIPPLMADTLLSKLKDRGFRFEDNQQSYDHVEIFENMLPFSFQLDKGQTGDFQLDLSELLQAEGLNIYGYIYRNGALYKLSPIQQSYVNHLFTVVQKSNISVLPIGKDQIESFLSQVVPGIKKIGKLTMSKKVSDKIVYFPLRPKVFVDRMDELLHVTVEYYYGDTKINPFTQNPNKSGEKDIILMRDTEMEQIIMSIIETSPLKFNGQLLYTEKEEAIYEFLFNTLPQLEERAEIFLTNSVKSLLMPNRQAPFTSIDIDSTGNWLEVRFEMDGIEESDIKSILQSLVEKRRYYRLPNGAFVSVDNEEFHTISAMLHDFKISPADLQKEKLQLPLYRGAQIEEIVSEAKSSAKFGKAFRRLLNRLKNPEELEFAIPASLHARLRDYQTYGFQWMKTLAYYGLGGILADDMGLGKTLQSIAFILSEKEQKKDVMPVLIVAPASLVYNWKNELAKFAPSLHVDVFVGAVQERQERMQTDNVPDVWITSYPTLRQDIEQYRQQTFSTLMLDEAQAIKNFATKTAKSVREIHAQNRFALTGTPIENSIDELWSIYQTIMPNFFPNQSEFRKMEQEKVAKLIRPFLLRRVKKDVLKELPEKIESVHLSELTKEQKSLYLGYLERIQQETKDSLINEGFQKSRIKILAGLTRLRQLCCHPSLFLENYHGESGKLQHLMELVTTSLENGKRMLIFSQFTSMLAIIRDNLDRSGHGYFYLHGQTKAKERVEMVDRFNNGENNIFLISLKAGSTGLNLTGADTVILYDLWWNPAVEEQAAGRAHRIGQKKVVQVIRLIAQGTIEEKIYELQQNKKELIEALVQDQDQALSRLTEQEIRDMLNI